ncbi:MAG: hypothetical protein JWN04_1370 [Myxococcaceae bacterium]|nr:hypothetical protein [Myxococcaceae bacterium]
MSIDAHATTTSVACAQRVRACAADNGVPAFSYAPCACLFLLIACSRPQSAPDASLPSALASAPEQVSAPASRPTSEVDTQAAMVPSAGRGLWDGSAMSHVVVDWERSDEAMRFFLAAMHTKNAESLLLCFSRKHPFYLTGTSSTPFGRASFKYTELERGLRPGGDFVDVVFGADGDDSFRDYVEQAPSVEWKRRDAVTFVPPESGKTPVFVRWRQEGKRYFVEEIAFPSG